MLKNAFWIRIVLKRKRNTLFQKKKIKQFSIKNRHWCNWQLLAFQNGFCFGANCLLCQNMLPTPQTPSINHYYDFSFWLSNINNLPVHWFWKLIFIRISSNLRLFLVQTCLEWQHGPNTVLDSLYLKAFSVIQRVEKSFCSLRVQI